jgi:hypothetical protein
MRLSTATRGRWLLVVAAAFAALGVGGAVAYRVAVSALESKLARALGPSGEMGALRVGWSGVSVDGLRIPAPDGWPATDSFRAERVRVVPSPLSVFSERYRIRSVTVTNAYLAMVRTRDGKLVALPGLSERGPAPAATETAPASVRVGRVVFEGGDIEIFDTTVPRPPLVIRLEQIEAHLDDLSVPDFRGRSRFALEGVVKGIAHDGRASIAGWVEIATRDSSVRTELRSVDLLAVQPYLVKEGEAGIRQGSFDLDLQSDVRAGHLSAPGKLTISNLDLLPEEGSIDTFMGLPRRAVLAALANRRGEIQFDFTLDGELADPQFSLNETLGTRLAYSLAGALGVDLGGLAKDVGTLGVRGGEATGKAAKGASGALWKLLKGESDD